VFELKIKRLLVGEELEYDMGKAAGKILQQAIQQ